MGRTETVTRPSTERAMTTEKARQILKDRDRMLEGIHHKMMLLYEELEGLEGDGGLLEAAAMPGRSAEGLPKGGGRHTDNLDVLERYYRQIEERAEEIRIQMWRLSEEAEDIRRLWSCFFALREPYYGILYELYVKKELYAAVEASYGYSHSVFENRRKEGLGMLVEMWGSRMGILELREMASQKGKGREMRGHGKKGYTGQMELPLDEMRG